MAALDALVGGLIPENQAVTDLKELGILPSTSTSTRINPYTSDRNPLDPNTGMETTAILQGIQKLDEKITGGFAQIIAKLSNTPIRGGGENKSHQSIEMSTPYVNPTTTQAPSFFNKMGSMYESAKKALAPVAEAPAAEAPAAEAPAAEAPAAAASVGGATIPPAPRVKSVRPVPVKPVGPVKPVESVSSGTQKGKNKNPVKPVGPVKLVASGTKNGNKSNKSAEDTTSSSTTTLQNPMTQITQIDSTSSLSGGRRRKRTRKSRRPTRRRSSRHRHRSRRH